MEHARIIQPIRERPVKCEVDLKQLGRIWDWALLD